jgi:peroxiredoxin
MGVEVGDVAPDFELPDQDRRPVRLSAYRGSKHVLVVFYPLSFTGTCEGELCAIRDRIAVFRNDDVETLAVSVDSTAVHARWASDQGFDFPILADFWPHGEVARTYGVLDESSGLALRWTFLVDREGVVRYRDLNPVPEARDQERWRQALAGLGVEAALV